MRLPQQSPVYLPPPTGEIPQPPGGLESLPLQSHSQFNSHNHHHQANQGLHIDISNPQALPLVQAQRYTASDCSHGPNLSGGGISSNQIPLLQSTYGVPNIALDVSQSGFETAHSNAQSHASSYDPPASGGLHIESTHEENPASSYGPPPSGNPADSLAYDSELKSSAVSVDGIRAESSQVEETNTSQLPGLDGAGLDIVSAKQSHSVEIPVQGSQGTYSLQFQAADPIGSQTNEVDGPNHKQLLSEGLLQSILSAIEQPNSSGSFSPQQTSYDPIENHHDVEKFIQSRVGQETLADAPEPKTE